MDVLKTQPVAKQEPTPEFDRGCVEVIKSWREGQLTFREAAASLTQYLQQATATGQLANQGRAEQVLGVLQGQRGNLESSLYHLGRARDLYQQAGNEIMVTHTDMDRGVIYSLRGDLTVGLELFRSIYQIAEAAGDAFLQSLASHNAGTNLHELKQYTAARPAYERALELTEQWQGNAHQKNIHTCNIHWRLAMLYLDLDDPEAAWRHVLIAQEIADQNDLLLLQGYVYRSLARLVTELAPPPNLTLSNNPDEYFQKALAAFQTLSAETDIAQTIFYYACSLAKRGDRLAAMRKFQQAMLIYNRLGMLRDVALATEAQLGFA